MRGVKYNCSFQNRDGTETVMKEYKMTDLLYKIEELLKKNYDINDRLSNQVIYNLQYRPNNVSRLLRLFVKVERA